MSNFSTSRNFSARAVALVAMTASLSMVGATLGCSSKNYVRSQTAPIVQNVNDLDTKTAANHRAIGDTDKRAQDGISGAMSAADKANQHALTAGDAADKANQSATEASNRVDSLSGVVANLDQYKSLSDVSVTFGFDKAVLTASDKKELDKLAEGLATTRGYILQVTGGTDSTGNADYNYQLSQRRADAVVNYLAAKYNVAPHRFYLVGIGKDVQVASDKTASGRAKNRRVNVQLMSNMSNSTTASAPAPTTGSK